MLPLKPWLSYRHKYTITTRLGTGNIKKTPKAQVDKVSQGSLSKVTYFEISFSYGIRLSWKEIFLSKINDNVVASSIVHCF